MDCTVSSTSLEKRTKTKKQQSNMLFVEKWLGHQILYIIEEANICQMLLLGDRDKGAERQLSR